ncbi:hypothetical protein PPTS312_12420 [Pseudomonas putida]|uniref:Uncharacterized protein n=1 Tax=Pseudomonas putida TaxID=303 RepID=A0A7U6LZT3_PSEPU|nr:hypothetical protein PPTS312_12420 [Pseudomonas putida]
MLHVVIICFKMKKIERNPFALLQDFMPQMRQVQISLKISAFALSIKVSFFLRLLGLSLKLMLKVFPAQGERFQTESAQYEKTFPSLSSLTTQSDGGGQWGGR